jgi:class 3 adenylate cyclase/predicted ATPase
MAFCPHCGSKPDPVQVARSGAGEIRLATVLFGDVKGFTAMSEDLPPEEVTDVMNRCFEVLSRPISKYGGTIDKYVGDAIMARFGAPRAHEDDPVRAINAALEMQQALAAFSVEVEAQTGRALAMRIGINTGQVMAGEVGSSALKQFTLMGDTVNVASRLEHEAEPGSILVGESTYRLASHAFEFEPGKSLQIRGKAQPVAVYVPVRPKGGVAGSRSRGAADRRLGLVGREAELAQLEGYLSEARAGQGRLVAVIGEPGVGKSRLSDEFSEKHRTGDMILVHAAAPSFGQSIPYAMLASFTRSLLFGDDEKSEISGSDLREALAGLVEDERTDDAAAVLADVLGVTDVVATDVSKMEARSRLGMLTNTLKLMVAARSVQHPVLVILDDMHWVDSASLAVFDQIVTGITSLPVMVLMLHRPGFTHAWSGMAFYRQINIREMPPEDARKLLSEFLGSLEIPKGVGATVIEKSGGNPFFLEQIMNSLVESGAIAQKDGKWRLVRDVGSITVPDTVQGILLTRIDQLSRGARSVLEVASVIGRIFAYRLLNDIVQAERGLDDHLQLLQKQEFIFEKNLVPELEYMFKHSLTQDVVYNGLLESQRKIFHDRVAETIESLGGSLSGEQLPLLAFHYGKTAKWEKALEYSITAGQRAVHLYANEDATAHFRQALALLEQHAPADMPKRLMVLEALGDIHEQLAGFEESADYYNRAREACSSAIETARLWRKLGDLAQSRGRYAEALTGYAEGESALAGAKDPDRTEHANIWLGRARLHRSRGALESASEACLRALAESEHIDEMTQASLYFELGEVETERGRLRSAAGYLAAASSAWERLGAIDKQALASCALADAGFLSGKLTEALEHFESALDALRRIADRHELGLALYGIGRTQWAMGNLEAAIDRYTEALALAVEIDDRMLRAGCLLHLGLAHLDRGESEQAEGPVNESYALYKQMRNWKGAANALVGRAGVLKVQGNLDQTRAALKRARNLANEMNDRRLMVRIEIFEAEMAETAGSWAEAEQRAGAGAALARDLSDARLIALAERVLGVSLARQRRTKAAASLLSGSANSLRQNGAYVDAARAALDYASLTANAGDGGSRSSADMLEFAVETFERVHLPEELAKARSLASTSQVPTPG